jgi:UDP-N-acetylmuramate-alanine ligase
MICPRASTVDAARYRATGLELHDFAATFCVQRGDEKLGEATLSVPGRHNVSNALGVIAGRGRSSANQRGRAA